MGTVTPRPSAIKKDKKVEISAKREGSPKDDGSVKKAEARAGRRSITIQRPAPVQISSPEPSEPSAAETPTLASTPSWRRARGATLVSFVRSPQTGSSSGINSAKKPSPSPRQSTWGGSSRFEHGCGWTRAKTRDEQMFQNLASSSSMNVSTADTPMPSGKSRFVVERPHMERSPPGTVNPQSCTAEGMGLQQAILKVPGRFVLTPRDENGTPVVASEGDVFRIQIRGFEQPTHSVIELDDGRLAVRWLPSVSGDFSITITCNGLGIHGSPFVAKAAQGHIDTSQCEVEDTTDAVMVGERYSFDIIARDQMGNVAAYPPLSTGGYSFVVSASGPTDVDAELEQMKDGLQKASLRFTVVGEYLISVKGQDGKLVSGRRHKIYVLPSQLDSRYCRLSGSGLHRGQAGQSQSFKIQAFDRHGNPCSEGHGGASAGYGFSVSLKFMFSLSPEKASGDSPKRWGKGGDSASESGRGGDSSTESSPKKETADQRNRRLIEQLSDLTGTVTQEAKGVYNGQYKATRAGKYEISVSYGGSTLPGCPYVCTIEAGPTHPAACMRLMNVDETAPLPSAFAGFRDGFKLVSRDFFGNVRHAGGDALVAGLMGPQKMRCEVSDHADGTYTIGYNATVAGEYALACMVRSEHVLGSPFVLRVVPATTHGPSCVANGNALKLNAAESTGIFTIEARDCHGNARGIGGDDIVVRIVSTANGGEEHKATVRDCEDGWYEVSYNIATIGRYLCHMAVRERLSGVAVPLSSSPSKLTISGGRTHAPACVRRGARATDRELPPALAGLPYSFVIEARDDFDEPRGKGGDPFIVSLTGPEKQTAEIDDRGDGAYEVNFTPGLAGSYLVGVTLLGVHIAGSRFALRVQPSSAHAPSCIGSGKGLRIAQAGEGARFAVQTWDAHSNVCTPPLSSFRVRLVHDTSPITVKPKGVEVGNGRYTFSYSTNVAGTYKAHIEVATRAESSAASGLPFSGASLGKVEPRPIAGSPFTVEVRPGATHPPACGVRWVSSNNLVAGQTVQLAVQSRDRYFNPRDEGGDHFAVQLRSVIPGGIPGAPGVAAVPNGAPPSPTKESIKAAKEEAAAKKLTAAAVKFTSGGAKSKKALTGGSGSEASSSHTSSVASIRAPHAASELPPQLLPAPKRVIVCRGEVEDHGDGSYSATVQATVAGQYKALLKLLPTLSDADVAAAEAGDMNIVGSPERRTSRDEEMRGFTPPTSEDMAAEAAALEQEAAIEAEQTPGSRRPKLTFTGAATLVKHSAAWKRRAMAAAAEAKRRGHRIFAQTVTFVPAETDPQSCIVSGEGLWGSRIMERSKLIIQPRDRYSNVTVEPARAFRVEMSLLAAKSRRISPSGVPWASPDEGGRWGDSLDESQVAELEADIVPDDKVVQVGPDGEEEIVSVAPASVSVSEGPGGAALASYLCRVAGRYLVRVSMRGKPVRGSPFLCDVSPHAEPEGLQPQRQAEARRFRANALTWQEETAMVWESHQEDADSYVRERLSQPGSSMSLGADTARTWALAGIDPASYIQQQSVETAGGLAGSRGRYAARKRTAMLHYRLSAMSLDLAGGGVSATQAESAKASLPISPLVALSSLAQHVDSLSAHLKISPNEYAEPSGDKVYGDEGFKRRRRKPDVPALGLGYHPALHAASRSSGRGGSNSARSRTAPPAPPQPPQPPAEAPAKPEGESKEKWSRLRHARRGVRMVRQDPPAAAWRVLGPEPEPPEAPAPPLLTPRAQALANVLEQSLMSSTI